MKAFVEINVQNKPSQSVKVTKNIEFETGLALHNNHFVSFFPVRCAGSRLSRNREKYVFTRRKGEEPVFLWHCTKPL